MRLEADPRETASHALDASSGKAANFQCTLRLRHWDARQADLTRHLSGRRMPPLGCPSLRGQGAPELGFTPFRSVPSIRLPAVADQGVR